MVCMFVKTTFLEGKRRYKELFSQQPPWLVLQFVERILCAKNGDFEEARRQGSAVSYCWCCWVKGFPMDESGNHFRVYQQDLLPEIRFE